MKTSVLRLLSLSLVAGLLPVALRAQTPAPDLKVNPAAEAGVLNPALPTIFVAGDSTAAKNNGHPIQGWGVPFADYFDPAKVNVVNRARGGRSSRTFISEGLWEQLLTQVKAGDVVLIQFGHNDASPVNEDASVPREKMRSRGSLPGLGEESREIVNVLTGKPEVVHTYGWYMRKLIADTKAKGATPVVLSLTIRNIWKDGKIERASGHYRAWSRALAEAAGIGFVDLSRILSDACQALGPEKTGELFGPDHTHTNPAGADFNAASVVAGLKGLRKGPPVKDWLSAKGAAVAADTIGWLNLPEPADPKLPTLLLIGDSTVRNGRGDGGGGQWGWGDYLGDHFDPAKVNVVNRAIGGLSSRTFLTQGHWDRAKQFLKPGDFVVMQFGHNDASPVNEDATVPREKIRARGTIKGTGEETEEVDNILTKKHEVVHSYGWYLRQFIRETKAAGATPVVCSPIPRKSWHDGHVARAAASYGGWAQKVAQDEGCPFIDLNELVARRYEELGEARVNGLFADANTHTTKEGAELNAGIVAAALRALPGDPLGATAR